MAQVILTRAVAQHANFELEHQVDAATVREALDALFARHPALRRYLLADTGAVRRHVNFFLNDVLIEDRRTLGDAVRPNDTIHVLQAVSGGAQ
jgi:molybdopterin synthase sulfur carrier subunit